MKIPARAGRPPPPPPPGKKFLDTPPRSKRFRAIRGRCIAGRFTRSNIVYSVTRRVGQCHATPLVFPGHGLVSLCTHRGGGDFRTVSYTRFPGEKLRLIFYFLVRPPPQLRGGEGENRAYRPQRPPITSCRPGISVLLFHPGATAPFRGYMKHTVYAKRLDDNPLTQCHYVTIREGVQRPRTFLTFIIRRRKAKWPFRPKCPQATRPDSPRAVAIIYQLQRSFPERKYNYSTKGLCIMLFDTHFVRRFSVYVRLFRSVVYHAKYVTTVYSCTIVVKTNLTIITRCLLINNGCP